MAFRTSDSSWKAFACLVALYWVAAVFFIAVTVLYRGNHPEQIHALYSALALILFWTILPLAFASSAAIDRARRRNEPVPSVALRTRAASWILVAIEVAFLAVALLIALVMR